MAVVADRLRAVRKERGYSQRELSLLCGLSATQVYNYENGISDPTSDTLVAIADRLQVSIDYLTGRTDDPVAHHSVKNLNDDEQLILYTYRQEGWKGVAHLSVENLAK